MLLVFRKYENLNGSVALQYRNWDLLFTDPDSPYWRVALIAMLVALPLCALLTFLLLPLLFFFAGCPICSVQKQRKIYTPFKTACQSVGLCILFLTIVVIVCFGVGVDNPMTSGNKYLDYLFYCRDPKPFQPDLCGFGGGYITAVCALFLQIFTRNLFITTNFCCRIFLRFYFY